MTPSEARSRLNEAERIRESLNWCQCRWTKICCALLIGCYLCVQAWGALIPELGLLGLFIVLVLLLRKRLCNPYSHGPSWQHPDSVAAATWVGVVLWIPAVIFIPQEPRWLGALFGVIGALFVYGACRVNQVDGSGSLITGAPGFPTIPGSADPVLGLNPVLQQPGRLHCCVALRTVDAVEGEQGPREMKICLLQEKLGLSEEEVKEVLHRLVAVGYLRWQRDFGIRQEGLGGWVYLTVGGAWALEAHLQALHRIAGEQPKQTIPGVNPAPARR